MVVQSLRLSQLYIQQSSHYNLKHVWHDCFDQKLKAYHWKWSLCHLNRIFLHLNWYHIPCMSKEFLSTIVLPNDLAFPLIIYPINDINIVIQWYDSPWLCEKPLTVFVILVYILKVTVQIKNNNFSHTDFCSWKCYRKTFSQIRQISHCFEKREHLWILREKMTQIFWIACQANTFVVHIPLMPKVSHYYLMFPY